MELPIQNNFIYLKPLIKIYVTHLFELFLRVHLVRGVVLIKLTGILFQFNICRVRFPGT